MAGDLKLSSDNSFRSLLTQVILWFSEIPGEELHTRDHEQASELACGNLGITQKQYQANKISVEGLINYLLNISSISVTLTKQYSLQNFDASLSIDSDFDYPDFSQNSQQKYWLAKVQCREPSQQVSIDQGFDKFTSSFTERWDKPVHIESLNPIFVFKMQVETLHDIHFTFG